MTDWIEIEVDADDAHRALDKIVLFLSDLRPFWPMLVPIFIGWMRDQFNTEGKAGGTPWAPLSPIYAEWKAAQRPGKTILRFDDELRDAASRPRRETGPREMSLWIDNWKAPLHQEGGGRLPARPIIPERIPVEWELQVRLAAEQYVGGLIRGL